MCYINIHLKRSLSKEYKELEIDKKKYRLHNSEMDKGS